MIDSVGNMWTKLAQRIVGELSQMHDRIHPDHIISSRMPQVFVLHKWQGADPVIVKPGITVKSCIQSHDIIPTFEQEGRQYNPDIAIRSGHQYTHIGQPPPALPHP